MTHSPICSTAPVVRNRRCHHRRERVRLDPGCARARLRLAISLAHRGWYDEARVERTRGRAPRSDATTGTLVADVHDALRRARNRSERCSPPRGKDSPSVAGKAPTARPRRSTARSARLRIGYVSAETRGTPSYYFFRPFLEHHDRSAVEVTLFNCSPVRDLVHVGVPAVAGALARGGEHSHHRRSPRRYGSEEFDVLVDLSGHFPFNGLQVLAERVAPVQVDLSELPGNYRQPVCRLCADGLVDESSRNRTRILRAPLPHSDRLSGVRCLELGCRVASVHCPA